MTPMTDEPSSRVAVLGLADVVDLLREDAASAELRQQRNLDAMELRVMTAINATRADLTSYEASHGKEHVAQRVESEQAHKRFDDFMHTASIAQAHRDGTLGVVRFLIELLGRNWKAIAAGALALLAASGNIRVVIG